MHVPCKPGSPRDFLYMSCHPSGSKNFKVAPKFIEICWPLVQYKHQFLHSFYQTHFWNIELVTATNIHLSHFGWHTCHQETLPFQKHYSCVCTTNIGFFHSYNKYLLVINVTALKRRISDGQNVEKRQRNPLLCK